MEACQARMSKSLNSHVDRSCTTIESLPNLEIMSSGSLPCQVPEESESVAQEVVTELYPMLVRLENHLVAELRQLRNEFEKWRVENHRQAFGESNFGEPASPPFASPNGQPASLAVAEVEWVDESGSPSFAPLGCGGERNNNPRPVVPTESIASFQPFRTHPFVRQTSDLSLVGPVDPLALSVAQLECLHSDCLLAGGDEAAAPMDDQFSSGVSSEIVIRTQGSEFGNRRMEEHRLSPLCLASACFRHSETASKTPDREMLPVGSTMTDYESAFGSRKLFQQAFMNRVLVLSAVLPSGRPRLDTMWYHVFSKIMVFLGFVGGVTLTVLEPALFYEHIGLLVLSIGVAIGLLSIRQAQVLIGPSVDPMGLYVHRNKIAVRVTSASYHRMALISLAWPTTVGLYLTIDVLWDHACNALAGCEGARASGLVTLSTLSHIFVSGFFTAVLLCLIRLLTAMEVIINQFVSKFFLNPKCTAVIRDWNHIHCLLRRTARSVDTALLAIVTSVSIAVVLHIVRLVALRPEIVTGKILTGFQGVEVVLMVMMVPTLVLFSCAIYCLAKAAHLTELCKRVPSLLNSMAVDQHHQERNSLVQFIAMSDASFQIKGVKLSASFILKVFYVLGAVIFGMMTTLMSMLSN